MKVITLAILLFSALAWAGEGSHPADYNVDVHVSSSSIDRAGHQVLDVVIHSKNTNYGLNCPLASYWRSATTRRSSLGTTTRPPTIPLKSTSFCSLTEPGRTWWLVRPNDMTPGCTF